MVIYVQITVGPGEDYDSQDSRPQTHLPRTVMACYSARNSYVVGTVEQWSRVPNTKTERISRSPPFGPAFHPPALQLPPGRSPKKRCRNLHPPHFVLMYLDSYRSKLSPSGLSPRLSPPAAVICPFFSCEKRLCCSDLRPVVDLILGKIGQLTSYSLMTTSRSCLEFHSRGLGKMSPALRLGCSLRAFSF